MVLRFLPWKRGSRRWAYGNNGSPFKRAQRFTRRLFGIKGKSRRPRYGRKRFSRKGRTFRRRTKFSKRYSRRYGRQHIWKPQNDGLAEYQKFCLPWHEQYTASGTGSIMPYRSNSMFDPDYTTVATQPVGYLKLFDRFHYVRVDWVDVFLSLTEISGPSTQDWTPMRTVPFWVDVVFGNEDEYKRIDCWPTWHSQLSKWPSWRRKSWLISDLGVTGRPVKLHFRQFVKSHIPFRRFGKYRATMSRWHTFTTNPGDVTMFTVGYEPAQQRPDNSVYFRLAAKMSIYYHGVAFDKIHDTRGYAQEETEAEAGAYLGLDGPMHKHDSPPADETQHEQWWETIGSTSSSSSSTA